jgi:hypothetical protein
VIEMIWLYIGAGGLILVGILVFFLLMNRYNGLRPVHIDDYVKRRDILTKRPEKNVDEQIDNSVAYNATDVGLGGFNIMGVVTGLIGIAIVIFVGQTVLSQVQSAMSTEYNTTSLMGVQQLTTTMGSWFPLMIGAGFLVIVIMPFMRRLMW